MVEHLAPNDPSRYNSGSRPPIGVAKMGNSLDKESPSPASKILNQMFESAESRKGGAHDLVDHNRFGVSAPRAFSPGLSSIGAAGFGMNGRNSVGDAKEDEERKMGNTFGSIGIGATHINQNMISAVPYPYSEDEN